MSYFQFCNVTFGYDKYNKIIDSFTFDLNKEEILLIKGQSGIGKSTILRIISGLEKIENGQIILDGIDITNEKIEKRGVGYLFQEFALFPHLNVFDNIAYGIKKNKKEEVSKLLDLIDLQGYEKRMPNELSGGQKQRVALARSLATYPKILLLDEPFSSLNEEMKDQIRIDLKKILKSVGVTTIVVSHDTKDEIIADKIIKL